MYSSGCGDQASQGEGPLGGVALLGLRRPPSHALLDRAEDRLARGIKGLHSDGFTEAQVRSRGGDWREFVFGSSDRITKDDFAAIERRILESGYRFSWSATASPRERPDAYKPVEGVGVGAEEFSFEHPEAATSAPDPSGREQRGAGENVVRQTRNTVGIARYIRALPERLDVRDAGKKDRLNRASGAVKFTAVTAMDSAGRIGWVAWRAGHPGERFWPRFCERLRREHPSLTEEGLHKAQKFNEQRYYYQGIGRYAPDAAYARGLADLQVLANLIPASGYLHGPKPTSIDAGIYGFLANIYYFEIDTPLRQFVAAHASLVRHCTAIHAAIG